jgi:dTDP-glucose 4,6-dehydratase
VLACINHGQSGDVYNIGSGSDNRITNNEIIKHLCQIFSKNYSKSITYISDRKGHDLRYALDSSKLRNLGWMPQYDLATGLKATVDWYQANESWWRPLI